MSAPAAEQQPPPQAASLVHFLEARQAGVGVPPCGLRFCFLSCLAANSGTAPLHHPHLRRAHSCAAIITSIMTAMARATKFATLQARASGLPAPVTILYVRALRLIVRHSHRQQGYGNSQGSRVWRGGNKQTGFDSESLG